MSEIAQEAEVCDHCGTDERTLGQLTRRAEAAERERDRLRGALERLDAIYREDLDDPGERPAWLAAALAGEEEAQEEEICGRCEMEPVYEELRICFGCSTVPGVVAPADPDPVEAERERCARIAETYPLAPDTREGTRQRAMREGIAAAIRGGEEAPCHYCDYEDQEPCFSAFFGYFYCTRPKGHDGVHVACSESKHAVAMVSVDTTPEKAREP